MKECRPKFKRRNSSRLFTIAETSIFSLFLFVIDFSTVIGPKLVLKLTYLLPAFMVSHKMFTYFVLGARLLAVKFSYASKNYNEFLKFAITF